MKINFKKISAGLLSAIILSTGIVYAAPEMIQAFSQSEFTIKVNGKTQVHPEGLKPIVYNNRTYLPAAFIAELLGAKTSFDSATKTVAIDMDNSHETELNQYKEKIEALEKEIEELKKENETATSEDLSGYTKMPIRSNQDGYTLTLEGLSVRDGNDGRLHFKIKNNDVDTSIKLQPMSTVLEINGEKYEPQSTFSDPIDEKLFRWIKRTEEIDSFIPYRNLPDAKDIKTIKITMVIEKNEFLPESTTLEFKVLKD